MHIKELSIAIHELDEKKQNLQRFFTALRVTEHTKGPQENLAVEKIKSIITGPTLY